MQDACASVTAGQREIVKREDYVVLRIDIVPWVRLHVVFSFYLLTWVAFLQDVAPTQIISWLQLPMERAHVLPDGKGKTLSHAYVEVKQPAVAGADLRGELGRYNGERTTRIDD